MGAIIWLNDFAANWLQILVERSLASALTLGVLAVIWLALRRFGSPHLWSWLFLLALLPLVAPVERLMPKGVPGPSLQLPIAEAIATVATVSQSSNPPLPHVGDTSSTRIGSTVPAARSLRPDPDTPKPSLAALGFVAWSLVVTILLYLLIRTQLLTRKMIRQATSLASEPVAALLEKLRVRMGIRRPVRIVASPAISSPATWGMTHPVVVLPNRLVSTLSQSQLRWVLAHELAHVGRRDLVVVVVQRVVQILYFFNPLVWLVNRLVDRQRECACDDAALSRCHRNTWSSCAEAFVRIVELASRPTLQPQLALLGDRRFLKRRVTRLVDVRRRVRADTSPISLLLLPLCAVLALPIANARIVSGAEPADEATAASSRAVEWLLSHQLEDGSWRQSADGAGEKDDVGKYDVGLTGISLLALLGSERTTSEENLRAAVDRGLDFLVRRQDEQTGLIGTMNDISFMYGHGYATLALARSQQLLAGTARSDAVERAVKFILESRNPYRGWRYSSPPAGDNDMCVTGLMLLVLDAAAHSGVDRDRSAFDGGLSFVERMTDPESGRTGYISRGGYGARNMEVSEAFPTKLSEAMTALALEVRMTLGEDPAESPIILRGASLLTQSPPSWKDGAIDYYYWWFGTRALKRVGGAHWELWRKQLHATLIPRQTESGAWPAVDAWSHVGGEVYATAINVLALQASR